jgi:hypothetical protein
VKIVKLPFTNLKPWSIRIWRQGSEWKISGFSIGSRLFTFR